MSAVESFEVQLDQIKVSTLFGDVWSARDLMPFAGYKAWQDWSRAINRAIESVNASGLDASDHFRGAPKMIETGKGARREVEDVEITRYGAYILFQNGATRASPRSRQRSSISRCRLASRKSQRHLLVRN